MGVVYLARDEARDAWAALKTLKERPDAFDLKSLRSEIEVLVALQHPGVVELIDHGVEGGIPWMSMALVSGHSLHAHVAAHHRGARADHTSWFSTRSPARQTDASQTLPREVSRTLDPAEASQTLNPEEASQALSPVEASQTLNPEEASRTLNPTREAAGGEAPPVDEAPRGDGPEPASRAALLGWVAQTCQALGYLHGEGVVHGDVKPGNVLISDAGRAILVDLGLVAPFGSRVGIKAMETAGMLAGSASTISPEQIRGEALDARADLYSIGCILFELCAGRPPFLGSAREKLDQHLRAAPPELGPDDAPLPLRRLIGALLAKERGQRPGHAQAIAHALLGLEGVSEALTPYARPLPPQRPYLYQPQLVGRAALRDRLTAHLAADAPGGVTLLSGESGVGKTRLAMALIREARRLKTHRLLVGHGACPHLKAWHRGVPLNLFAPVLRQLADACVQHGARMTQQVVGHDAATLAALFPFIAELPGARLTPLVELPADAARQRLYSALTRVLLRYGGSQPTLVVLDDVQWADPLSLGALEFMSSELVARRWRVVGFCRSEETPPELLERAAERGWELVEVPPLGDEAMTALMAQMLGQPPSEELRAEVAPRSGGNAFFIAEYLRLAVEQGLLVLDDGGRWRLDRARDPGSLADPDSILALIRGRLERLTDDQRRLCEAAAVLGREVPLGGLAALSGLSRERLQRELLELRRRRILEPRGEARAWFVHDKLREVAYDAIADPAALHHDAAAHLLEREARGDEVEPADVALHALRGGDAVVARRYFVRAARQALSRYALRDAQRAFEAALELFDPDEPEHVELRLELAERILRYTDLDRAVKLLSSLLEHPALTAEGDPAGLRQLARIHTLLGVILTRLSVLDRAEAHFDDALRFATASGDAGLEASAHEGLGIMLDISRHLDRAEAAFEAALRLSEEERQRGRSLLGLGLVHMHRRDVPAAHTCLSEALAIFTRLDDRPNIAQTLLNRGSLHRLRFEQERALADFQSALEALEGLGSVQMESAILNNVGISYHDMGRLQEAIDAYEASLACIARMPRKPARLHQLPNLANAYCELGRFEEALGAARETIAMGLKHPQRLGLKGGYVNFAWVSLVRGDLDAAQEALERSLELERVQRHFTYLAESYEYLARTARVRGELERSEAHFNRVFTLYAENDSEDAAACARVEHGRLKLAQGDPAGALALLDVSLGPATIEPARAEGLVYRARAHRLLGDLDAAARDLDASQAIYERTGQVPGLAQWICERGHLAHARGEDARTWLERAEAEREARGYLPQSEAAQELRALQAALGAGTALE